MFQSDKEILLSLRDFIGDALAEPDISPTDIIDAIIDELKELQDYHKIQQGKSEKLLGMLQGPADKLDFNNFIEGIEDRITLDDIGLTDNSDEDIQDTLTFGDYDSNKNSYDFKLTSEYLKFDKSSGLNLYSNLWDGDEPPEKGINYRRNK